MKIRNTLLIALVLTFASPVWASPQSISVDVNGLVCDFCARALEKVFSKQDAVENINIDLKTKRVTINLKEGGELNDEAVTKLVTDSGYNIESISRGNQKDETNDKSL